MRIGIDISQMVYSGAGVAVYIRNLVTELRRVDKKNEYVLFGSTLRQQLVLRQFGAKTFPLPPTAMDIIWNRLHVLPVEILIGKTDVFHSSDWTQPPTSAKKVTTIHDLLVYKYPEFSHGKTEFRTDVFAPSPNIVQTQKRRLEWVKKECDLIVAVSEATKRDIVEVLGISEGKIRVVYEAARLSPGKLSDKYRLTRPYILAVGTREPRKNLDRLVQAYQELKNKDVELVVAGGYGWGKDVAGVKLLGYVPNEELAGLYSKADVFAYPSLYEGFGIPILEAFSCGCPVVTSNVSSMPEVGGKAAIYVDPLNVSDIAEKIDWVLSLGQDKRKDLVRRGREQAAKFSWEKTARETIKVYEELG